MQKKITTLIILLSIWCVGTTLIACKPEQVNKKVSKNAITFTDSLGKEVTVDNPQKVAILMGSYADVWQLAGGTVSAVTQDAYSERDLKFLQDVIHVGEYKTPNIEKIIANGIDFATYLDIYHQLDVIKLAKVLKNQGKTVIIVLHDLNLALQCADTIMVMNNGEIVNIASPQEIIKENILESVFKVKTEICHTKDGDICYLFKLL